MNQNSADKSIREVEEMLDSFREISVRRDMTKAKRSRMSYFEEINRLAVSKPVENRLTFQDQIKTWFGQGKEKRKMSPALVSILVALTLFFGGGGIGIAAAQDSLPDTWLYPLKLTGEDIQMALTSDVQEKMNLELDFSQNRLNEIIQMIKNDQIPGDKVFTRLDNHLMTALNLAAFTSTQNSGELTMLQNRVQEQIRLMEQQRMESNTAADAALLRTRSILENQYRQINERIKSIDSPGGRNGAGNPPEPGQSIQLDTTPDQIRDQDKEQDREQEQDQDRVQNQTRDQDRAQDQTRDQIQEQITNQPNRYQNGQMTTSATPEPAPIMKTALPGYGGNNGGSSNGNGGGNGGSGGGKGR